MKKVCAVSGKEFEITNDDLKFYEKMGVPTPTLCPEERQRRRLAFRNERKLYWRECDKTGKKILSIYAPSSPCKRVLSPEAYWGDSWDGKDYGRDFDFGRLFFEQFIELFHEVPQLNLFLKECDNSNYCHDALRLKNCFLIFDGEQARDVMYGETFLKIQDCLDFLFLETSELCYECVNCRDGYRLFYSFQCQNCTNSWFLKNCVGCQNCFGCVNLHRARYSIFNKQYTKDEYEKFLTDFKSGSYIEIEKIKSKVLDFRKTQPSRYLAGMQNENATGDFLSQCKDSFECFDCNNLRDCKFCSNMLMGANDCYDVNIFGGGTELCCDSAGVGEGVQNIVASYYIAFGAKNISHSAFCWLDSKNLFGCVGMRHAEYCIFNKQYTESEYSNLKDKIIEHMKKTGEWGEFFPIKFSPFAYNESVVNEHFPLTKEEVLRNGYRWKDENMDNKDQLYVIPDLIEDVPDSICNEILACKETGKNYKIQKEELKFYRKMNLPIPRLCPDERHKRRMALRNPRKLWKRKCDKCGIEIETTFSQERSEKVYCEKCYLNVIN